MIPAVVDPAPNKKAAVTFAEVGLIGELRRCSSVLHSQAARCTGDSIRRTHHRERRRSRPTDGLECAAAAGRHSASLAGLV